MRVLDWLARTVMLVLASLATLALIGSLASVSNSTLGKAFPGRVAAPQDEIGAAPIGEIRDSQSDPTDAARRAVGKVAPPEDRGEIARWLKALTYALLALGGFVAAGVIAMVRIAAHLRRIAER